MKNILHKLGISTKKDAISLFWQFFKFGLVGVSNTAVALGIYYLFIWLRDDTMMALAGQTVGWIVGVANAFFWNWKFVFKKTREVWRRALIKMYMGYGLSLAVTLLLTWLQVERLGISIRIAPLTTLLVTVPLNFLISKYWSFQER